MLWGLLVEGGGGGGGGGFISLLVSSQLRAEGLLNQNTRGSIIFVKVTCGDLYWLTRNLHKFFFSERGHFLGLLKIT